MICPDCGHYLNTEDKFCPNCGSKISLDNIDNKNNIYSKLDEEDKNSKTLLMTPIWNEENLPDSLKNVISPKDLDIEEQIIEEDYSSDNGKSVFLFPIISALIACSVVVITYSYEHYTNWKTLSIQKQAESLALSGDIDKSLSLINDELGKRPNYESLQVDLKFLNNGKNIYNTLTEVDKLTKQNKLDEALDLVTRTEKSLSNASGPFFKNLNKKVIEKRNVVSLALVKNEMKNKKSLEELIPLYEKVLVIDTEQSKKLLNELKNQICNIAYNNANEYLNKKNFDTALTEINKGLQFDKTDKKLLSLSKIIQEKKNKFEQEEKKRIEQAIASAVEEENKNQINSVKVLNSTSNTNSNGDFIVSGEIKNIGTKPIYSIKIFYDIYNSNGQVIASFSTFVYPNYLHPGDKGKFEFTHYDLKNAQKIQVTKSTWSVE
ncbi:FxLYD domain-containing protein [Clostridium lundense]|uniref:FxLYD domain-containing protein n=1 Tax=Clostridium lundense TaxID=319475 RepID=UPI000488299A|nr:FxLYD domain-containing protein [Clostridium lundense]